MTDGFAMNGDAGWLDTSLFAPRPLAEIEAAGVASRPHMEIVDTRHARVRIRAERVVDAPTLIILPDGPNGIEQHDPVFDALRGEMSVVAIEIPGLGFSYAKSAQALTFDGTVDALVDVIAAMAMPRLVITGSCSQAYVAIALAARLPATIGVIASQATDLAGEKSYVARAVDPQGFLRVPQVGQLAWARPANRALMSIDHWYAAAAGPAANVPAWQETARWALHCGSCFALGSMIQNWFGEDDIAIPQWTGPAKILFGLADRTHAKCGSDTGGLLRYLPNADLHLLPGIGHFPELEDVAGFTAAIRALAEG